MILSIFENYEFLNYMQQEMNLNNNCGELLVEILNNYDRIKETLENEGNRIYEMKTYECTNNNRPPNALEIIANMDNLSDNLKFFYNVIQYDFFIMCNNFQAEKVEALNFLEDIKSENVFFKEEKKDKDFRKKLKEEIESRIENYSFSNAIRQQYLYMDSLIYDLNVLYEFVEKYEIYKNDFYFRTFEIPRRIISCVIQQNNKIRLLESPISLLCGELKQRKEIENKFYKSVKYLDSYQIEKAVDLFNIYRKLLIDEKISLKKCKNCGKYFIPHNKQVYCDNPSPQNPNKTCRLLADDMRNNKEPIYETYRNNYKTQSNKKRRNNHISDIQEKFDKWNLKAREKMEECKQGKITLDEYKIWLKNSQNWIKGEVK